MKAKLISFGQTIGFVAVFAILNYVVIHLASFGLPDWAVAVAGIGLKEIIIDLEKVAPADTIVGTTTSA